MFRYVVKRIVVGLATALAIVTIAFFILRLVPGDPVEIWLGDYYEPALAEVITRQWGLDKPLLVQYGVFMGNLARGDLGESLRTKKGVGELIGRAYPFTLRLMLGSVLVGAILGTVLGTVAARHQNSALDVVTMAGSFTFISFPSFLLAYSLIYIFCLRWPLIPILATESPGQYLTYARALFLPSLCVGLRFMAMVARMVRSEMLEVLSADFVTTARSKGLPERVIVYSHALRNGLSAVISLIGVEVVVLLGGVVIPEVIFTRPGLGRLYFSAISSRDYPLIQGCILVIAIGVVTVNLLVDILYSLVDPRVRYD